MLLARLVFITSLLCAYANADMAPNYPEPGTVWKAGEKYEISWLDDNEAPPMEKAWKKFKIDLMTGDNINQKFLKNVARDLDASKINTLNWTAPDVDPHAPIYFLMFTNDKGDNAWTTRFTITGADGKVSKPEHDTQPDGAKIPWGIGKMAMGSSKSTATFSMNPAMASAAEKNAAVVIAVSKATASASANLPSMFTSAMFLIGSLILIL